MISDIFELSNPTYNLRNKTDFVSNHVYFGTESLSYLGPKLWDLLPQDLKTFTSLTQFKSQVKKWGSAKLPLPNLQKYTPRILALYNPKLLHLYAIYLLFIYLLIYLTS